jgi:A/G-specific adenine glycosylase
MKRMNSASWCKSSHFSNTLIGWHERHGRHDLPWQRDPSAYRVWVSEIMLQQTQVATVIGYYDRFMQRFPDMVALAAAPIDEVLHLWSGLGYYSRARNLHRAAQVVVEQYDSMLSNVLEELVMLPGIGRSTAAAIISLAFNTRATILDGNVKRVLARYFAIDGPLNERSNEQTLWQYAEECTPQSNSAIYTQAIMDFGATLCTRAKPLCMHCPLQTECSAFRLGRVTELPMPRKRLTRPTRQVVMVLAVNKQGEVLLQCRPPQGIWGGLWTPPQFDSQQEASTYCEIELRSHAQDAQPMAQLRHAFTHFDLEITPVRVRCQHSQMVAQGEGALWYSMRTPARIGLPAPIATLLARLELRES